MLCTKPVGASRLAALKTSDNVADDVNVYQVIKAMVRVSSVVGVYLFE